LRIRRSDSFTTITVAGQVLPADLLQRIADKDKELGGLGADSYHLSPSETISEATSRAWNKLVAAWVNFKSARDKLPANDPGTTVTRERWLLPLFQELGYGRLAASRSAVEIDGKGYAVSHWWSRVPIHLVGAGVSIDKLSARIPGAARSSPHSLVQELLNRSDESLWGFVSNGSKLRILRDNQNLVRQAYVEFDLETMMEGEAYSDFVMLWLLCHQSRVEADKPIDYWLEKWSRAAQERGVRALEHLREGVEGAISFLGGGFLAHRANTNLKEKLRSGLLDKQDYYRQLLRLVYRLLFLFVAEDRTDEKSRSLLFDPAATPEACERYTSFYSTNKLRRLAERRHGSRHSDLFAGLRLVMQKLGSDDGCRELGLPALGSFLFSENAIAELNNCEIANHDFLDAVRALAFAMNNQARRQIDYKNLGSEELGSVYESLLELHPQLNIDAATFTLATAAGHERKTTGSYYTHDSLVQCLLDSALEPVVRQRESNFGKLGYQSAEDAILDLKICDPACGSGHFLIAAGHRIAKRLAGSRTGDDEPSPEAVRHALRDVVGRCLYGVDINPMAVELCKVSLWMEALEPGKPLSFLDHHIQCGNSLIGTTPALMKSGIPNSAFKPIEGDDREACSEYKKQNKREREQEILLGFGGEPWEQLGDFVSGMMNIETISDETIEGVRARQKRYESLVNSNDYRYGGLLADAWCAAFFWRKLRTVELPYPITEDQFRRTRRSPFDVEKWMEQEIKRLATQYGFFHWHLAFPGVFRIPSADERPENQRTGWSGGFDLVLGNPPWDQMQFREQEFFALTRPDIAHANSGDARKRLIRVLQKEDPVLYDAWDDARQEVDRIRFFIQTSDLYPLTGRGRINTYGLFAENMRLILNSKGRVGGIVPTGIATDDSTKLLFQEIIEDHTLVSLYDFENRVHLFPSVDSRYKFCLLTLSGSSQSAAPGAEFVFFAHSTDDLREDERRFTLSSEDIYLLNPNTRTCPIFRSKRDAELTKAIYRRVPLLIRDDIASGNPWGIATKPGLFNMAGDSGLFRTKSVLESDGWQLEGNIFYKDHETYFPLYEGKMFDFFDHRAAHVVISATATLRQGQPEDLTIEEHQSPSTLPQPRYWVPESEVKRQLVGQWEREWLLGWKEVTSSTNERTMIPGLFPRVGIGHKIPIALPNSACELLAPFLVTCLSSFVCDYTARQKLGSVSLTPFTFKQLPSFPPGAYEQPCPWDSSDLRVWLNLRLVELTYTAWDMEPLARDLAYYGPPFCWDEQRRFLLRSEFDAAFFHLYGVAREDVDYIMETFPIVKRKDEQQYGEFRTKRIILEIYDEMAQAIATGQPFQTRLNPPPADPAVAHSPRVQPLPLVLPSTARYPQPDHGVYMLRVILSILQESGGSIDMGRLMNACSLLAMPDTLETYGARIEPDLAQKWRRRFSDQFRPDLFLAKLDDLVQRGEIKLVREDASFKAIRVSTADLVTDLDIEFDARFALRIADSLGQAEREGFAPMATREEIESRSSEAA
jgi:hypothetical protein